MGLIVWLRWWCSRPVNDENIADDDDDDVSEANLLPVGAAVDRRVPMEP